jgi:gluconolactonase
VNYRKCFLVLAICAIAALLSGAGNEHNKPKRDFRLLAQLPQFWDLVDHESKLTVVASGFGFTEGPVWDPAGFLYVSDEGQNKIYRVRLDGTKETLLAIGDPDGNTYDQHRQLIDCASVLRAIIRVQHDGKYIVLADKFEQKKFNSPNDVTVGPDGALYFTDPTLDLPPGQKKELAFQGVYRLDKNGSVRLLVNSMSQPNGLAFSPDGKRLYVDDSERKDIRLFDFDSNGTASNERVFGEEKEDGGVPDGMRVDEAGDLYVTGPKGVWIWDPQGHHLGTIVLPEQPANLTWGDSDYRTLYITANTSVYRLQTKIRGFVPYLR